MQLSYIIGIAGGSCVGKTWLANQLHNRLGKLAGRLSLDDFYKDLAHLPFESRAITNFDHPGAIDWPRLEEALANFKSGKPARVPRYDFKTHSRLPEAPELQPAPVIIMEGLWLFSPEELRNLFALKIFIEGDLALCGERRIERDTRERGRTREQVVEQFWKTTAPMQEKYVLPQMKWADVALKAPITASDVEDLLERIQTALIQKPNSL